MILREIVIEGTLKPDGTLELDGKPNLPSGRVEVTLRRETPSPPPEESLWQFLQRSRRDLEASGASFLNGAEVASHIDWLRESDPTDESPQIVEESVAKASPSIAE